MWKGFSNFGGASAADISGVELSRLKSSAEGLRIIKDKTARRNIQENQKFHFVRNQYDFEF